MALSFLFPFLRTSAIVTSHLSLPPPHALRKEIDRQGAKLARLPFQKPGFVVHRDLSNDGVLRKLIKSMRSCGARRVVVGERG